MRKRILCGILSLCFFCALILTLSAVDPSVGKVLFAQRYADFTDPRQTGVRIGTGGGVPSVTIEAGEMHIDAHDDRKVYVLLPDVPDGAAWTDTYTVEFSFRFTEIAQANGYFGFLMSAEGDAPLNRTEVILRAGGTCDGIGTFREEIATAMRVGETMSVSIPVRHGMMYEIRVQCGAHTETLTLPSLLKISEGRRGFVLRNASAAVQSVSVVSGVDYTERTGEYASVSYKPSADALVDLPSPSTGECTAFVFAIALASAWAARRVYRRRV